MNHDRRDVLSRREILGGGLFMGAMFLAGCASPQRSTALPNPRWPRETATWTRPPVARAPVVPPRPVELDTLSEGVVPRSTWTRSGVARPFDTNPMGLVKRITVHHDGMPPTTLRSTADVGTRIEQIRRAHVTGNGWADIGYHYIIDPTGRVWEGRDARLQGAHVKDNNENNIGVLVLGNFDEQRPTDAALGQLDRFVAFQMKRHGVPLSRVYTHREIRPTACPGSNLQAYMVRTRERGGQLALAASTSGLG